MMIFVDITVFAIALSCLGLGAACAKGKEFVAAVLMAALIFAISVYLTITGGDAAWFRCL